MEKPLPESDAKEITNTMPRLTFLGAAGTVSGSRHLLESNGGRVLFDCGLFQGERALRRRNWQPPGVPPGQLDAVVLTHGPRSENKDIGTAFRTTRILGAIAPRTSNCHIPMLHHTGTDRILGTYTTDRNSGTDRFLEENKISECSAQKFRNNIS